MSETTQPNEEKPVMTTADQTLPAIPPRGQFDDTMGEISGFGGGYEATCRAMVTAGVAWLDANPDADPQFHGYKGVYGIITEDNDAAKQLTEAVVAAAKGDCTGAMHQATIGHVLAIKKHGWDYYVGKMREKGDE